MTDWYAQFNSLSDDDKNKLAVLRLLECSNGCIQYAYRDDLPHKLQLEETRNAMNFSMSCMKTMTIPLKSQTVSFTPYAEELCRKVRKLYISGVKHHVEEDFNEFMNASAATVNVVGKERLIMAKVILSQEQDVIPECAIDWGYHYLIQFLK